MNKILITGASGFTGSELVKYLSLDFEIISLARESSDKNKIKNLEKNSQIAFFDGSYNSIEKIFKNNKIHAVIHAASIAKYDYNAEEIDQFIDSSINLGTYILHAMSEYGCKKIVNFSTYWQHYNNKKYQPICLYAALKQSFEDIIDYYCFDKNISAISLKPTDIYGANDSRAKILNLLKNNKEGETLKLSKGFQKINLVHINDVLRAVKHSIKLLDQKKYSGKHKKYFLFGKDTLNLRQIVALYKKVTGKNILIDWGGLPYRKNQIMKPFLGQKLPNWNAKTSLEDGLLEFKP